MPCKLGFVQCYAFRESTVMDSKVEGSAANAEQWKAEVSQEFQAIFDVGPPNDARKAINEEQEISNPTR